MDDEVYKNRQDQTLTVSFAITTAGAFEGVRALAWTTTPWTLPTNAALAVGPAIDYAVVAAGPNGAADGGAAGVVGPVARAGGRADAVGFRDQCEP